GNNSIEVINKTIPESCVVNHGTKNESESKYKLNGDNITAAEAIQVSEKFFNLFPIKISEGKSLETADFNYHNDNIIPVILGSTYRKSFKLGDKFEGYYICERKMFKVIGFADSGYQFYLRSGMRMEVYDNYIMIPFEKFVSDSHYARASLLQQICGFIVPHSNHNSAVKSIQKQLKDIGLEAWIDMITVNKKSIK
ncbi:MAG: ABC transporter permease, partial [Ruminococcus sp.]|nr:ABC transporter permease [Candidatus Copronaster equi]